MSVDLVKFKIKGQSLLQCEIKGKRCFYHDFLNGVQRYELFVN